MNEALRFDKLFVIGGTAVQTSAYPTLCHVGKRLSKQALQTFFIDGATRNYDKLEAVTPRDQSNQILTILEANKPAQKILFLSHCLGMAAALNAVSHLPNNLSRVLALSPPLPSPLQTIKTQHSKNNIKLIGSEHYTAGYSWSDRPFEPSNNPKRVDVKINPQRRIDELNKDEKHFMHLAKQLDQAGRLKLVTALRDWNESSLTTAKSFNDVLEVDATHSLSSHDEDLDVVKVIYDYANQPWLADYQ